jgi:hypothetical protein
MAVGTSPLVPRPRLQAGLPARPFGPVLIAAPAMQARHRLWMVTLLCPLLVLSAQALAYVPDLPPTYYLAKAWPALSLPFAIAAIVRRRQPGTALLLALFAYTTIVTPILSMLEYRTGFIGAMQSAVKMGGFLSYLSLLELLLLLRPSVMELRSAMLSLGLLTFATIWTLWILVPLSYYQSNALTTLLFFFDLERGPRIYAPMVFGFFFMFYTARRFWLQPRLWRVLLIIGAFASLLIIYKQKLAITSAFLVIVMGAVGTYRQYRRLFIVLGLVAAVPALLIAASLDPAGVMQGIGGSLETRLISAGLAIDFLQQEPIRWLIGAGSLGQHASINLGDLFRFDQFYLSDLGWLGIIFEYGLLGTALIAGVYIFASRVIATIARPGDAWTLAMFDHCIYLWCVFCVYSAVVAPGEIMTLLTLAVYTGLQRQAGPVRNTRQTPRAHSSTAARS